MKLPPITTATAIALASLALGCHSHHSASAQQGSTNVQVAHAHGEASVADAKDGMDHDGMHHDEMGHGDASHGAMGHGGHSHGAMEVSSDLPIPEVELIVTEDAVRGWNVHTKLTNFSYAPEDVNETSLQNEGHAHLYVNGEKLTRLYSSWYYISDLPAGDNEIMVTLNANGHEDLTIDGEVISDAVTIEAP